MDISLCTITFRHELVSLPELIRWASENEFDGIELWGVHALKLGDSVSHCEALARANGVRFSMLSDYFLLRGDEDRIMCRAMSLYRIANRLGVKKVRTFAGGQASHELDATSRKDAAYRLKRLCDAARDRGLSLLVETHPGTLADTMESTERLLEEVDHPALKINFDVLHVWESGADPIAAYDRLRSRISHLHLKNIRSRADLGVFAPANVYAASGVRDGMTPLFEGAYDYEAFFRECGRDGLPEASLEWFGDDARAVLSGDLERLARYRRPMLRGV